MLPLLFGELRPLAQASDLAMAEILWTYPEPKNRDFADFERRATVQREALVARGVNAAPIN